MCLTAPPHPQMRCCGVTDYTDWYPVLGENTVPDRCCMENSQGCGRNSTTPLWRTVRREAASLGPAPGSLCGGKRTPVGEGSVSRGAKNGLSVEWGGRHMDLKPKGRWKMGCRAQLGVSRGRGQRLYHRAL